MEINIMKKQIIAAAVAASVSAVAMADISITGNAKYEYDNTDNNGTTTNTANTEVNLMFKGKSGDTSVVANLEFQSHGAVDTAGTAGLLDIEDLYMTTKVGDVTVKAGNYASSTSAHLGEIDNGGRASNKVTLGYTMGDISVYAGNSGAAGAGDTALDDNMFAGVVLNNVMGNRVEIKKHNELQDSFGIRGAVGGVDYRVETADHDTEGDTTFASLTTKVGGLTINYSTLDADNANALDEDDSGIFALSTGHADNATATGQDQLWVSTDMQGTKLDIKAGSMEKGISTTQDRDYTQVKATRKLASGATAIVTFTDQDMAAGSKENLEIELNVAF